MVTAFRKSLNIAGNALFFTFIIAMVLVVGFMVKGKLDNGVPAVGPYQLYVVLSGSMSPTFDTGSLIGVEKVNPQTVQVGDVITFKSPEDEQKIITHRVISIDAIKSQPAFKTQGDANNAPDSALVPATNLIGRENFAVPYAGYITNFASSKKGMLFLIIIPAVLVIIAELIHLFKLAGEYDQEEKRKKELPVEQAEQA